MPEICASTWYVSISSVLGGVSHSSTSWLCFTSVAIGCDGREGIAGCGGAEGGRWPAGDALAALLEVSLEPSPPWPVGGRYSDAFAVADVPIRFFEAGSAAASNPTSSMFGLSCSFICSIRLIKSLQSDIASLAAGMRREERCAADVRGVIARETRGKGGSERCSCVA